MVGISKHRFPNLACMKLSAYYKNRKDEVELLTEYRNLFSQYNELKQNECPNFDYIMYDDITHKGYVRYYSEDNIIYDKILISKVFTDTPIPIQIKQLDIVEYNGTGFYYDKATPLPYEIEHIMPDYHLYDEWVQQKLEQGVKPKELEYYTDYSIGFTTRGCIRQCSFCVNKNYKQASLHSPVEEFLDKKRKYICMLDDNVLACKDWKQVFESLQKTGKRFQFKQGCDERLLTDEKCEVLFNQSKWVGDYIFAFDKITDTELIQRKLQMIREHTDKQLKFYVFCGFNHSDPDHYNNDFWKQDIVDMFKRIQILMSYHCLPYIMRYKDYELSPYRGMYIDLARWCNQPSFFKKKSFREFCKTNGVDSACYKYMEQYEHDCPEIKDYYEMKWTVTK